VSKIKSDGEHKTKATSQTLLPGGGSKSSQSGGSGSGNNSDSNSNHSSSSSSNSSNSSSSSNSNSSSRSKSNKSSDSGLSGSESSCVESSKSSHQNSETGGGWRQKASRNATSRAPITVAEGSSSSSSEEESVEIVSARVAAAAAATKPITAGRVEIAGRHGEFTIPRGYQAPPVSSDSPSKKTLKEPLHISNFEGKHRRAKPTTAAAAT